MSGEKLEVADEVEIQSLVVRKDVYIARDKEGFWCYYSELSDGRWIIEYDLKFKVSGGASVEIGPFGVRRRTPLQAGFNVGRVLLTITSTAEMAPEWAELSFKTVSRLQIALSSMEAVTKPEVGPVVGIVYCFIDDELGVTGLVEHYGDGPVFRLDTGEEIPVAEVVGLIEPFDLRGEFIS